MKTGCANCGAELDRPPCRIKANQQFCDHACHTAFQQRRRVEVACVICGAAKSVPPSVAARTRSPVCGPGCERERISRMRIDYFGSAEKRLATCGQCGKAMTRRPSDIAKYGKVFCGRVCSNMAKGRGGPYTPGFTERLKRRIRERDGNACRACGLPWKPKSGNLVTHHVDEHKLNHADTNLVTLCRSCHVLVHSGKIRLDA
jgi:hypothetical protein